LVSDFLSTNGTHTFKMGIFERCGSFDGSDCAWIDYISFPKISFRPNYLLPIGYYDLKMHATSEETINITNIGSTTLNYTWV